VKISAIDGWIVVGVSNIVIFQRSRRGDTFDFKTLPFPGYEAGALIIQQFPIWF
jgi:hypothetical protein